MIRILLLVGLIALLFILGPFITSVFWAWVVPDVFAGAVAQNILPESLTWLQALKFDLFLYVLALTRGGSSSKK